MKRKGNIYITRTVSEHTNSEILNNQFAPEDKFLDVKGLYNTLSLSPKRKQQTFNSKYSLCKRPLFLFKDDFIPKFLD